MLLLSTVVFLYDVYEVVLGDQCVLRPHLGLLSCPPLLLMEVGRIEKLGGHDGSCGFDPVYHFQKQPLVVVVEQGDGCSSVSQPTCPTHLNEENKLHEAVQQYANTILKNFMHMHNREHLHIYI